TEKKAPNHAPDKIARGNARKWAAEETSRTDRDRCKFYLDRATSSDPDNFAAWNDRAWVALVLEYPNVPALAQQYSETSLKINRRQQRPLYNLSVSDLYLKNYAAAEAHLTRALE